MYKVNKVLIVFLSVVALSFLITWTFLQSDTFGNLLSRIINEYSHKAGIEVKVQKVNFSFFPPGGVLKGVKFVHRIEDNSIEADLDELILHLGFWNFWNEKPHLQNIEFRRGIVNLRGDWSKEDDPKLDTKSVKFDLTKDFLRFQNISNLLPVKISGLQMSKIDFKAINNKYQVFFNNLKITKDQDLYKLDINAYPEIPFRSFKKPILIDQIKGNVEFDEEKMVFEKLGFKLNGNVVEVNGEVDKYLNKDLMTFKLDGNFLAHLMDLEDFLRLGNRQVFKQGIAKGNYRFNGKLNDFKCESSIDVNDLITEYIDFNQAKVDVSVTNSNVIIKKLDARYFDSTVELQREFIFADLKNNLWVRNEIPLLANNLSLKNALKSVPVLKVLSGNFTGPVSLQASPESFQIFTNENVNFENLKISGSQSDIIKFNESKIDYLDILIKKDNLKLNINFDSPTVIGELKGDIVNGSGTYVMNNTLIDFDRVELLEGKFPLSGQAAYNILASTNKNNQTLSMKGVVNNSKLFNFNLSNLSSDILFLFHEQKIKVNNLKAAFGQDNIVGSGEVSYKNNKQNFEFKVPKLSFRNFSYMLKNYIKDVEYFPESLITKLSGQFKTEGGLSFSKMKLSGRLYANGGELFGEKFSYGYADIFLERGIGLLDNMLIKKSESDIKGSFSYNFNLKKFSYDYNINPISLQNINFFKNYIPHLESKLSGRLEGSNLYETNVVFDLSLSEAKINNQLFEPSKIIFKSLDERKIVRGNLLGNILNYDILFDFSEGRSSSRKKSKINLKSDIKNIKDIANALSREHFNLANLSGSLIASSEIQMNINNWSKIKLDAGFEKILFNTDLMTLDFNSTKRQFSINNSQVKSWDFKALGRNIALKSEAKGSLGSSFEVTNTFEFDLSLLSNLFRKIQRATGKTVLTQIIKEKKDRWEHEYKLTSNNFTLATDLLPFNFKQGTLDATMADTKLSINNLRSDLSEGKASLKGELNFETLYPVINARYTLSRAGIDLFRKSKLFLSGNGAMLGRRPPYILSGDLTINRSYVVDEFQDIIEDNRSYSKEVKYLPENSLNTDTELIQLNVDLKTDDYISISNSVTDTKIKVQGNLTGNFEKLAFDGFARLYGNKSKVYFKSAEYDIKKLDLLMSSDRELSDPEIDVWATSTISDYAIDLKAYGRKDDLNFSLSSEPNLSQNDIISLVAFGYTNKISNDLSAESREALTRAGIGSFVFDQIGLNKTLKREFGLQLSLGTQFQNDEDLLNQRTGSNIGRVRSATKIEIKKDITDKVDLSLATTVGGNIGETRSMNLNYDLKDNVSVQGVYEIITNEQGDENRIDNSAGADLKFRWEFK